MTEMITPGQKKQILRFCEDALAGLRIPKDEVQLIIENGGKFQSGFLDFINTFARLLGFIDEEVIGYPQSFRIRSVEEQVEKLLSLEPFNDLDASHVTALASGKLPDGAKGWGVIPELSKVAESYHQALGMALELLAADRQFGNWMKGKLTEKHLRLMEKTAKAHAKLNVQPGDFWVFPFQFGSLYEMSSVLRGRRVLFAENEFGLGVYEAAVLLLTHSNRINCQDQLSLDCAGVEYSPQANDDFYRCLSFYWNCRDEQFVLNYDSDFIARPCALASGFLVKE